MGMGMGMGMGYGYGYGYLGMKKPGIPKMGMGMGEMKSVLFGVESVRFGLESVLFDLETVLIKMENGIFSLVSSLDRPLRADSQHTAVSSSIWDGWKWQRLFSTRSETTMTTSSATGSLTEIYRCSMFIWSFIRLIHKSLANFFSWHFYYYLHSETILRGMR